MAKQPKDTAMTSGNIWLQILFFSIPLLIGNLFQQLYNTVDSIIVGNYIGSEALAAVGSSNSLINLIIGLFMGIATGAGVVISQYYGAKNKDRLFLAVHTSIALTVIGGVLLVVLGILLSPLLLRAMGTPEEVMGNSVLYLRIFFCGSLFNLFYNMGAGILRGVGDSKSALYYLCAASVVNIVLDILFVAVLHMGVDGVGWATVIAQLVSAVLVLLKLMRTQDIYKLEIKKIKINKPMMMRILKFGIPSGVQSMIISLSNVIVQANINAFGASAMAGCGAYMKIDGFVVMPIMSFGLASMTFVGQNYGAGRLDRVKRGTIAGVVISFCYTVAVSVFLYLFGMKLIGIFSSDSAVVDNGYLMMSTLLPYYWTLAFVQVLSNAFRGTGRVIAPTLIMVGNMCIVRMLWVNIATPLTRSLTTVLQGYPVSWILALVCVVVYAWKSNWIQGEKRRGR